MVNESDKLKLLKELLLTDDTTFANRISERINHLENHLNDNDRLSKNVKPIIEEELEHFVKEMPKTLGPTITKTLKAEIKNSKDEVVEALFPILGKMIKKYVAHEMELLKESINSKTKSIFSFASFKRKAKSKITGISEEDLIVSELANPKIEEVFVRRIVNIGTDESYGLELGFSYKPLSWFSIYNEITFNGYHQNGSYKTTSFDVDGLAFSGRLHLDF